MADVKWIKLSTDMFDNPKIKYIRTLPEGNNMLLIWIMIISKAGKCNSNGYIFLTENIPYTPKMLADELKFDEMIVKLALETFSRLNMVQLEEHTILISGWNKHQNIAGLEKIREDTRKRVEKYRAKQKKPQLGCNVTCNVTETQGNDIEEEKEKEEEIERERETEEEKEAIIKIVNCFNSTCGTTYKNTTQTTRKHILARLREGFSVDDFNTVIRKKHLEWAKNNEMSKYLRPNTLFGTKFESYLNQIEVKRTTVEGHAIKDEDDILF